MGNTGRIIKSKTAGNFTTIPNDICQSPEMTLEEKGLLAYLLSLPCDWVVYRQSLYNQLPDVKFRIDKAFKSLQERGYIRSIRVHSESTGKFMGWDHIVHDQAENSPTSIIAEVGDHRNRCLPKSAFTEIGDNAPIQKKQLDTNKEDNKERSSGRFVKPSMDDVQALFQDKGHPGESDRFYNYYESNGWKVGKNPMKNWKAAAQNWIKNLDRYGTTKQGNGQGIGKNDYKSAAAQYDFDKYGDTPVGQIFAVGRTR